ncbi:Postreplication repair E3 ubiquitin-protein ligase rad18 [Choanephora cucurbitarum]|uniref:Postreplication repair E3 ubiquitin-protein ligase RAD18 n=1 Tax=Choanephora cucurbitarum TaxID=101091 RepID=A0A1C7NA55_9FUNG|nr:Postreplication repair E3 ubiquitin-protein ligase rad18 [Choanephora cucurbitarum]
MSLVDTGFDDPTDFNTTQLQVLDEHLRCPICKELFNTTMMLSTCSHSFCALCIRRSLSAEQKCPKCRKEAVEKSLIHNYDLDNVVQSWKDTRPTSVHDISQPVSIPTHDDDIFQPLSTTRRSTRIHSQTKPNYATTYPDHRSSNTVQPMSSSVHHPTQATSENMVECPICQQSMQQAVVNIHLDRCLKGDRSIPVVHQTTSQQPTVMTLPITKSKPSAVYLGQRPIQQVFGVKKDKEIKSLLKSYHLPDHGDRKQMIWRYTEYVTMWNANNDSESPVSAHVLIQRLQKMENSMLAEKNNQLKRKTEDTDTHRDHYKDDYSRLIDEVKRRK